MALVNLKTQYTSLKFGNDQKGGGDSGLPYVKFDMNGDANTTSGQISVAGTVLSDFPKRGGTYPSNLIDLARIKAFLADNRGKIFVDKQKTLQFMNPKMETGPSFLDSNQANTLPGLVENTRVYSSKNLLGQVGIEGTGGHLARVGLPNFGVQDEFYASTVGIQNLTNSAVTNRLLLLSRLKIASGRTGNTFSSFENALSVGEDFATAKKLGIAINNTLLFNYPGGPNSSYGVGSTVIGRYTDTTLNTLDTVMNYKQIMQQNAIKDAPVNSTNIIDFRTKTQDPYTKNAANNWNYAKDSMQNRIGLSNPGAVPSNVKSDYTMTVSSDKINERMQYIFNNSDNTPWDIKGVNVKDSIKFGFECLSNDNSAMSTALVFRALLSNGFTDNNGAVLNSFRYMGRGEEFHTYQGFTRQISFSFKIAVFSRAELQPLYNKLNYLISQVYPDYSSNTNIMRAPLVKVTVGDYLYRVPGFLESVNVTADNNTPWEINLENSSDVQELPHVLDVAISFKPIHSVLPQRSAYKNYQASGSISGGDSFTPLIGNSFIKHASEVNTMSNLPITPIPMFSTQISNQTNLQPLQVPGAAEQNASQQVNSASPYPLIDISGIIPMGKI